MEKIKSLFAHKVWRIFMWAFLVLLGFYVIAVAIRVVHLFNLDRTEAQVAKIHATKLTMDDVLGKNLPPDPGILADQTVEGIDANRNGIRDDVELAIFREYPNSVKTRAVLLQYALALQMEVTQQIINTMVVTEIIREQSRGFQCVGNIITDKDPTRSFEKLNSFIKFVKDLQFNTGERQKSRENFLQNLRSYSDLDQECDIDYSKLSS